MSSDDQLSVFDVFQCQYTGAFVRKGTENDAKVQKFQANKSEVQRLAQLIAGPDDILRRTVEHRSNITKQEDVSQSDDRPVM